MVAPTIDDISRRVNIYPSIAEGVIEGLVKKGTLLKFNVDGKSVIFHRDVISSLKNQVLNVLRVFHKENPLKIGIEENYLKTILGKNADLLLIAASLNTLMKEKAIKVADNKLSLIDFRIEVSTKDKGIADKVEEFL